MPRNLSVAVNEVSSCAGFPGSAALQQCCVPLVGDCSQAARET